MEMINAQMRWNLAHGDKGRDDKGNTKAPWSAPYRCPKCRIAVYKNKEHCKKHAAAHRKDCGKPPYWIPGKEEDALCQLVEKIEEKGDRIDAAGRAALMAQALGKDEDDESWESDDSEDTSEDGNDLTKILLQWFDEKTYQHQRVEWTGFTEMYHDDE